MLIRKATLSDSQMLFNWRNDPLTRSMSRNNNQIHFFDHEEWLKDSLSNRDKVIYIVEIDYQPIGVVRFDKLDEYKYEVNIDINSEFRGNNYGFKVTAMGINQIQKDRGAKEIFSTVKKVNLPSLKLFERLGFQRKNSDETYNYYLLDIKEDFPKNIIKIT